MRKTSGYHDLMQDPRWKSKRLSIIERSGRKCEHCGQGNCSLHVHHTYYENGLKPWEYDDDALACLCETCHGELESALQALKLAMTHLPASEVWQLVAVAKRLRPSEYIALELIE